MPWCQRDLQGTSLGAFRVRVSDAATGIQAATAKPDRLQLGVVSERGGVHVDRGEVARADVALPYEESCAGAAAPNACPLLTTLPRAFLIWQVLWCLVVLRGGDEDQAAAGSVEGRGGGVVAHDGVPSMAPRHVHRLGPKQ